MHYHTGKEVLTILKVFLNTIKCGMDVSKIYYNTNKDYLENVLWDDNTIIDM